MIIESSITLDGPVKEVWEKLLDPACLKNCIPGCESVSVQSNGEFKGTVKVKIGPIKARFDVVLTIVEMQPPVRLVSKMQGRDRFHTGRFTQENQLALEEINPDRTRLTYTSNLSISGKIATFGERIFRAKAKEMEKNFLASLSDILKHEERKQ
ncbi:putative Carbon monoxide dehydrogenase subunit G [uncultured Desulfobacterium sp.]|uniref:Putative Carbon monoxide dehydrogenase subunit G n=1 Tax=uncultured Desulfobacterium sp. TaxID=201089 RepID=A0A445N0E6_9BACT|nr:putative Carbon monoxide dehydrogenase subunit G [uncultured Desulfobacterium sp.]